MSKSSIPHEYEQRLVELELQELELPRLREELDQCKRKGDHYGVRTLEREISEVENARVEFLLKASPYIKRYYCPEEKSTSISLKHGMNAFVETCMEDRRGELYAEYMAYVENDIKPEFIDKLERETAGQFVCTECQENLIFDEVNSATLCPRCGLSVDTLDTSSKGLTYDQEQTSTSIVNFAYKRSNHLAEHLACFQGKETTTIPDDVISSIRTELKKQRIVDSKKVTASKVKEILKKLKLQKYYEHTQLITYNLNGIKPPRIDETTEEQFKALFNDIQHAFNQVCPKNRKNFLSYSYVLRKLSELLNRDDLIPFFPLLKSREKLHQQDMIWKDICNTLKYQYIASI